MKRETLKIYLVSYVYMLDTLSRKKEVIYFMLVLDKYVNLNFFFFKFTFFEL